MGADGPLMEDPSSPEWILRYWILLRIPAFSLCVLAPLREILDPGPLMASRWDR
jgi:hypothetical protein